MTPATPDEDVLVSVLVPVLDEAAVIQETAAAMRAQLVDGTVELLFVDGGSADGTREQLAALAAEDPSIRLLENPRQIVPAALNVGLAAARGRYVARMDAHSWYPPDYLARGIERLERGDVTWVAGPAAPRGTGRWSRRVALALASSLGQGGSRKWRGERAAAGDDEHDLDTGVFAGVWRRETLERLGGWDERFVVNEDAEMAARVLEDGGRIVCVAAMSAEYAPRETLRGLWRQYWRFGYFRVRTARLHPTAIRRPHLAAVALAATAAATPAPGRLGRAARAGIGLYSAALVAVTVRARPEQPGDAVGVPVVLAVMHLSWGSGFLAACARHGVPLKALVRAVRGGP